MSPALSFRMIQRPVKISSTECILSVRRFRGSFGPIPTLFLAVLACPAAFASDIAPPPALELPLACTLGSDCWIVNFVDVDPGPGTADFTCGPRSYDGHKGTDFGLLDLKAMALGVEVRAAAAGTVLARRDGMPDTGLETAAEDLAGRDCGNGVVIAHEGGWTTQYCHMRLGSVSATEGRTVERGDRLGLVGMSGRAEFPHLHITLRQGETVYDPFTSLPQESPCGKSGNPIWAPESGIDYRPFILQSVGFAPGPVERAALLADAASPAVLPRDGEALVLWVQALGVRRGDRLSLRIDGPDGRVLTEKAVEIDRAQAYRMVFIGRRTPSEGWTAGRYRGTVSLDRPGDGIAETVREIGVDLR
jgi:hypothetical protein